MVAPNDDPTPRVFMSWKTVEDPDYDPDAITARARLGRELSARGYEPWSGAAPVGLPDAKGAVAIVSPIALHTEWMQRETRALLDRATSDPAFVLVALSTDGILLSTIVGEPYERLCSYAVDETAGLDAQVDEVLRRLAPLLDTRDA